MGNYRVLRYVGIGIEDEFGTPVSADAYVDIASSDLDSPSGTQLVYEGGLSRGDVNHRPGPYIPEGGIEYAFDVNTIAYLLYLVFGGGTKNTLTDDPDGYDFEYEFSPNRNDLTLPSATIRVGKDNFEHMFQGCIINELTLSMDNEFAMANVSVIAQKDGKDTLVEIEEIELPEAYPIAFHELSIMMGPKGGEQEERTDIESFEITISNNGDGAEGVRMGSRYPRELFAGELTVTASIDIAFNSTKDIEKFWGASDGPSDVTTEEQNVTLIFNGGTFGTLTANLPKCIFESINTQPSGRDRLVQSADIRAFYDEEAEGELIVNLKNNVDHEFITE